MKFWRPFRFPGKMAILPAPRLLLLLVIGFAATFAGAFLGLGSLFFVIGTGVALGLSLIDVRSLRSMPTITAKRETDALHELGKEHPVRIHVTASEPLSLMMWVQDDFPQGFRIDRRTMPVKWESETGKTVSYTVSPHRRGKHRFGDIHLRLTSPLGFLILQLTVPAEEHVQVFPVLDPVRKARRRYYREQMEQEGIPHPRTFGMGPEFSHLREYQPDDEPRRINWMASARHGKLMTNVMQPATGHEVAILLDAGRLMGVEYNGRSRLDTALEAALGYAAVALRRGERVSLTAFSDRIHVRIPPAKGLAHLKRIIEETHDLAPRYAETDFQAGWDAVQSFHRPGTLVTVFTDASAAGSLTLPPLMTTIRKKHAILFVTMQEPELFREPDRLPENEKEVFRHFVIRQLLEQRARRLGQFRRFHATVLDVEPDALADRVIDAYLMLRMRTGARI
ncbi:DUF58 domain-containing protein [Staphylospora marina]|uniref:DUF58 domain-containing protein n=1 Tax=Staphylospora marina TaxID=2490858 RepID=UPI0013DE6171|nr:DUF58 domain-containing protein [Staphylospora marina]